MLLKATCKKCKKTGHFDIGSSTREEIEAKLKKMKTFHCNFGSHMEIISPIDMYDFDWDNLIEGNAPTEEQFLVDLKKIYPEVYTTKELREKYTVISFMNGGCLVHSKTDEDDLKTFSYVHSPKGERYYFNIEMEL